MKTKVKWNKGGSSEDRMEKQILRAGRAYRRPSKIELDCEMWNAIEEARLEDLPEEEGADAFIGVSGQDFMNMFTLIGRQDDFLGEYQSFIADLGAEARRHYMRTLQDEWNLKVGNTQAEVLSW